jgi:hypothetical protein
MNILYVATDFLESRSKICKYIFYVQCYPFFLSKQYLFYSSE